MRERGQEANKTGKEINKAEKQEIFALLGCYAAQIGGQSRTFLDNLTVPSSRVKQSKEFAWTA
jgi:hypothetical protein